MTVVHGPNGAGKTNLLEALYFGCTGGSCRTSNEREVVRFGSLHDPGGGRTSAPVTATTSWRSASRRASPSVMSADGAAGGAPGGRRLRPLVSVFLPDRLELVKGPPALRRAHLDQFVAALWPARRATRRAYSQALAQRNALLARVRAGVSSRTAMATWDGELARHGIALRDDRAAAVGLISDGFAAQAAELGLSGDAALEYRPRSRAADAEALAAELAQRLESDLDRGFTGHGPHRDDLSLARDGRELRVYGSQGEQRLALLALLLAEREVIAGERGARPLLLLDDVMSELDADRRALLVDRLATGGQSVVTTTDLAHVPGADGVGVARLAVAAAGVVEEVCVA